MSACDWLVAVVVVVVNLVWLRKLLVNFIYLRDAVACFEAGRCRFDKRPHLRSSSMAYLSCERGRSQYGPIVHLVLQARFISADFGRLLRGVVHEKLGTTYHHRRDMTDS